MKLLDKREVVTLSELRSQLLQYRRQVQQGQRFRVEYYAHPIAWLVPVKDAEALNVDASRTKEMGIVDFRANMNEAWESLDSGQFDVIWLMYHDTPKMALVKLEVWEAVNGGDRP